MRFDMKPVYIACTGFFYARAIVLIFITFVLRVHNVCQIVLSQWLFKL